MATNKNEAVFTLLPQGMSKLNDFLPLLPIGRSTVLKMVEAGEFPKPYAIGKGTKAWKNAEVLAWIDAHGKDCEVQHDC